ncbi:hypothetical protein OnM2_021091 [Erysiphe neolycopersici]|uniref:Uncharacterized protein n=1 Tax=Erysiphe neolycopersici TaxID=212602 RepID=A0A420I2U5_9PEZI|nr:hypothetical protein OnM2_021091 [Erysiphe neolycopersici]
MPFKGHTSSPIQTQSDRTLISPSNINMVSTWLHNDSAIQEDNCSHEYSPKTLVSQPRKITQTNFKDTFTFSNRETEHNYNPRKDFKVIKKHDMTTEEEFEALPINIQRKYISTLERLNFVQNSEKTISNFSHQQVNLQQDSHSPKSYQSSTYHRALDYLPSDANLFPSSQHTLSLAERRGKQLDRLNSQVLHSLEQSHQSYSQKSASSILSNQSPYLENFNFKLHSQDKQYRRSIILDTTGNVVERKSPINYSYSVSSREIMTPSSDDSMLSSHIGPAININIRSGLKNSNTSTPNGSTSFSPCDWVEDDKDLYLDISRDKYHSNISLMAPKKNTTMRSFNRQEISGNRPRVIMTSSPLSPNFEYLSSPSFKSRSRAQSLLNSIKHEKAFIAKEPMLISKGSFGQIHRPTPICSKSFKDINSSNTIPNVVKPLSGNHNSISGNIIPKNNIKPQSAGAVSKKDPSQELNSNIHANNETLVVRKRRSYTISSKQLPSFTLDPSHPGTSRPTIVKKIDSPLSSGNNQMTLRMTLTRPDLRADESKIYAWQDSKFPCQNQYPADEFNEKFEGKGPFGGPDGWGIEEKQDSKVKKFWNRMTQNLKSPTS